MEKSAIKKRIFKLSLFFLLGIIALIAIYLIIVYTGFGIKCPFHILTGLNCPGCGNTRAVVNIMQFRFLEGLSYNYLFPLEAFYMLRLLFISSKSYILNGKFSFNDSKPALDIIVLVILGLWFILRNILGI